MSPNPQEAVAAFSRAASDASHKVEMRGEAPAALAIALDALAMADGKNRNAYVVGVLEAHVRQELSRASLLNRVLRGNAYLSEATGGQSE